jgi:hypothetical protein
MPPGTSTRRAPPGKRTLIRIGIGVFVVATIVAPAAWLLLHDEPPHDDSDLLLVRRSVPHEENGFFAAEIGNNEAHRPDVAIDELDGPGAAKLLGEIESGNAAVFRKLDESLAKPDFLIILPAPEGQTYGRVIGWWQATDALVLRSRLEARVGSTAAALASAVKSVRFCSRVQRGEGGFECWLAAHSLQQALRQLLDLIVSGRLSVQELAACRDVLREVPSQEEVFRLALAVEYQQFAGWVDGFSRGTLSFPGWRKYQAWFLKPNREKRRGAEKIRKLRRDSHLPASRRDRTALTAGSPIAEKIDDLLVPDLGFVPQHMNEMADSTRAVLGATQAIMALHLYRAAHGQLPATLAQLVPEHLDAVPIDPYDGCALRYSPEKKIVYSVGTDFTDSGGSRKEDPHRGRVDWTEPTFRIDG